MIRRVVPRPAEKLTELPERHERRVSARYSRRLESFWQFLGFGAQEEPVANVSDLSLTGLRLVCQTDFEVGAVLLLRLPTATMGWNTHLARVKHCARQADGRYRVGCAFVQPLSDEQLAALLV